MIDINNIFFELLQVALGTRVCLSHTPDADEWGKLYEMAKKQSLVGVCFSPVQKLQGQHQEPPEMLYLKWMGMAAKIQQRNEIVTKQCAELQAKLSDEGFRCCILKGQGVAQLYSDSLRTLRQSGDIDVWVSDNREVIMAYIQKVAPTNTIIKLHADFHIFQDTDVEVHFKPTYMRCPWTNRRLQDWFKKFEWFEGFNVVNGFRTPSDEFNLVFIALHIFRHLMGEGIGLRQLMDYYFVLIHVDDSETRKRAYVVLESLGLSKFAGALMWICKEVFGLDKDSMICEPDPVIGDKILREIEIGGNFGHHDDRKKDNESMLRRFMRTNATNLRFLPYFPAEVLSTPIYRVAHKCWQLKHGYNG